MTDFDRLNRETRQEVLRYRHNGDGGLGGSYALNYENGRTYRNNNGQASGYYSRLHY